MPTLRTQFGSLFEESLRRASKPCSPTTGIRVCANFCDADVASFVYSYWLGVRLLLQCRPCHSQVVGQFKQLLNNLMDCSGYLGFIESCSEIRMQLCMSGSTASLSKGKTQWARSLIRIINDLYQQPVRHPSRDFNLLMTFLNWLKRVPVFIRQPEEAVDEYLSNEERLQRLEFDPHYVSLLRSVWLEFYGDFAMDRPFRPRHGSGSTADAGRVSSHKWRRMHTDQRCRVLLKNTRLEVLHLEGTETSQRIAKVVFVPKQAGKDRTICMEPSWIQYLQQGVFDQLREYLRHSPARNHFDIHNQDINRDLCARAYVEGFSTIDLSNASDSVSWALIKKLAYGSKMLSYLYATRSDVARVRGREIRLAKFAPMGSALCFPVECMLFACIVETAYRIHYGQPSRGHLSGVSVYGDDIICPTEIYHLVVDILSSCGFIVNEAKSFETGPYFESCGVEYLYGAMIETIRHPRAHLVPNETESPDKVGLITDLANTLLEFRSPTVRRDLLKTFEGVTVAVGRKKFLFHDLIDWSDFGLKPVGEVYRHTRWDRNCQRSYYSQPVVVARLRESAFDFRHYKCLSQFGSSKPAGVIHPRWTPRGARILARMGHYDLLSQGEIESVGPCRAGRLHYTVTLQKRYV